MTKPHYLNSDGSDAGPGWINYKSPEKIAAPTPEPRPDVIALLREIRDKAWQYDRQHEQFSSIENMAESALGKLGIKDGPPYPNPRTKGWWEKAGTPETPGGSISVHDGTKLTSGETLSAISAQKFWWDSDYGLMENTQPLHVIWEFAEAYAADLREKLSTAERQYQSLVRCIDASDDDAQAVIKTLNERLTAAEAELARWREMIRTYVLSISGIPIAEGEDEVDFLIASHAALQERERKGE